MLFGEESSCYYIPLHSYRYEGNDLVAELYTGATPNNGPTKKFNLSEIIFGSQQSSIANKTVGELKTEVEKNNIVTKTYLLGTDQEGRDMLSRLMIGSRVSLSVGFIALLFRLL